MYICIPLATYTIYVLYDPTAKRKGFERKTDHVPQAVGGKQDVKLIRPDRNHVATNSPSVIVRAMFP